MRQKKPINVDCPVCGFKLRGSASEGYRCLKCNTHYGTAYVRSLRRRQFKDTIHRHFVRDESEITRVETEQESRVVIDDFDKEFQNTIKDAFERADEKIKALEEVVSNDGYIEIVPEDLVREFPPIMIEKVRPEVKEYTIEHVPVHKVQKKSSRKKSNPKKRTVKKKSKRGKKTTRSKKKSKIRKKSVKTTKKRKKRK